MRPLAACLTVLVLAGCAGPRPPAPSAAVVSPPAQWRTQAETSPYVQADWWASFNDPALSAVVETALARNTDVAIAAARVEEARAQYQLAQAQRLPNLVGAAGGGRQQDVSPFGQPRLQTVGQA
ncbi:MAG: TolC family protein, partial [Phenylobacterium sp.]